jgi:hypothetical protein
MGVVGSVAPVPGVVSTLDVAEETEMPARVQLSRLCMAHTPDVAATGPAHLLCLVRRVADRDRVAFADLCDRLFVRVLRAARSGVPDSESSAAVVVATLMEVWWMARFHAAPGTDVHAWLDDIVSRRVADRVASRPPARVDRDYDRHTSLVLAAVLGRSRLA